MITNLLSAIPYFGPSLVEWVWGGFAVGSPTLVRFFALHYLLPFVVVGLVVLHIFFLHEEGSSNPVGVNSSRYKVPFHYYYSVKDLLGFAIYLFSFVVVSLTLGYYFIDAENFIPANPLVTPVHIQPEWYFLFAYAILRSIPNKLGGVCALVLSILVLFVFPLVRGRFVGGFVYRPVMRFVFWLFIFNFIILTWLGMIPAEPPFVAVSMVRTGVYFSLVVLMWLGLLL